MPIKQKEKKAKVVLTTEQAAKSIANTRTNL